MPRSPSLSASLVGAALILACGGEPPGPEASTPLPITGTRIAVRDTLLPVLIEASGTALPLQQSTLSTKVMATVEEVLVQEGDRVSAGQLLVRLDSRDLDARRTQVDASLTEAAAMVRDAEAMARRIRALFADSAATRVQLEQAETGLIRAQSAVRAAESAAAELEAVRAYAEVRAPFAGLVTRRLVDPGALAAPGTPLVMVEDPTRLRVTVATTPESVRGLRVGSLVAVEVEGRPLQGEVEGVVRGEAGNLARVNVLVANPERTILSGSAASVFLPQGEQATLVVPGAALIREGDLIGVDVIVGVHSERRWIRIGRVLPNGLVEVRSGVMAGDAVLLRSPAPGGE